MNCNLIALEKNAGQLLLVCGLGAVSDRTKNVTVDTGRLTRFRCNNPLPTTSIHRKKVRRVVNKRMTLERVEAMKFERYNECTAPQFAPIHNIRYNKTSMGDNLEAYHLT